MSLTSGRAVVVEEVSIKVVRSSYELKVADGSDVIEEVKDAEESE